VAAGSRALTGAFRDPAPCGNEILDDRLKQSLGKHLLTIGCLSRLFAPRAESQIVLFADLPAGPTKVAFESTCVIPAIGFQMSEKGPNSIADSDWVPIRERRASNGSAKDAL